MKKYTKEITALLTLVTAGVIGGSVYAAETQDTPTAGVPIISREEDITRKAGDSVCETETTPELLMGDVMIVDTEPVESTAPTTYDTTPMMGTQINPTVTTPVTQPPATTTTTPYKSTPMMGTEINPTYTIPVIQPPATTTTTPYKSTPMMGTQINPTFTVPVTQPPTITPVRGRGDIDGNGRTDLSDLLKASMYVLGDIDLNETELIEADMTQDGTVDIADLPAMRMKIMTPQSSTPPTDDTNSSASMTLDKMPDKTEYKIGEPLDLTGTVISARGVTPQGLNWDIFSHKVSLDDTMVQVNASSFNNKVPGTYSITISYETGYKPCSTSFYVTVTDPDQPPATETSPISSRPSTATMKLTSGPNKTEYKIGESLDITGTSIMAYGESDGICWDIPSFYPVTLDGTLVDVDASSFNNQVPGTYEIKISYSTRDSKCSTSFTVTVTE